MTYRLSSDKIKILVFFALIVLVLPAVVLAFQIHLLFFTPSSSIFTRSSAETTYWLYIGWLAIYVFFFFVTIAYYSRNSLPALLGLYVAGMYIAIIIFMYANAYRYFGLTMDDKVVTDPFVCLYFSIVTWTTLGAGDIKASVDSRMFTASQSLISYMTMGIYVAMVFEWLRANREARKLDGLG